jgi:small-conductance mechanosensitive channel
MNTIDDAIDVPLPDRLAQIWANSAAWVTGHSTRIIMALILGAVIVGVLLGIRWLGQRIAMRTTGDTYLGTTIARAMAKTRIWFIIAAAAQIIVGYAHAPEDIARTVYFAFVIAATLQAAVFVRALILGTIEHRAQISDEHAALSSAMGVIRLLVSLALFAIAIVVILSNLGVDVTGLIAGFGIGGIAIGLAAQGIFADLFAALAILFDRPFRKGDSIRVDTVSGTVEDIGLKSTRIRALTGEQIIVANKQLLEKEIHNLARLDRRRIAVTLGIAYQTRIDLIDTLPATLQAIVEACDHVTIVRAGFVRFSDSTLDIELQYDVHSEDYDLVFATQHQVNVSILRRFAELGIAFAYPTQTSFTAAPDGSFVLPYAAPLAPDVIQAE